MIDRSNKLCIQMSNDIFEFDKSYTFVSIDGLTSVEDDDMSITSHVFKSRNYFSVPHFNRIALYVDERNYMGRHIKVQFQSSFVDGDLIDCFKLLVVKLLVTLNCGTFNSCL